MADLVTLEQAKTHLRVDTDADDSSIALMIEASTEAIASYLKWDAQPEPAPALARHACLILVGFMYREREGSSEYAIPAQYGYGYLPAGVTDILFHLRKPSLA